MVTFKAAIVEDQGKNKFLVEDAGQRIEVKAGPDWHHTVSLPLKQPLIFTGEVHAKDKDGQRKTDLQQTQAARTQLDLYALKKLDKQFALRLSLQNVTGAGKSDDLTESSAGVVSRLESDRADGVRSVFLALEGKW